MGHCPGCGNTLLFDVSGEILIPCPGCGHEAEIARLKEDRQQFVEMCLRLTYARDAMEKERDALRADLTALAEAIDTCLGGRGAYSCAPTHDCRCDKDRGISDECVCGADALTAALNRPSVQAILKR